MSTLALLSSNDSSTRVATVQANQAWQPTQVTVPPGIEVTIAFQSGKWTADPNRNHGQLYDANGDPGTTVPADYTSYPVPGAPIGALVARFDGTPFLVGDGTYRILSEKGGMLELCINDDLTGQYGAGLTDNEGSIDVEIAVYANTNTKADLSQPLVSDPAQMSPEVPTAALGPLQHLIGTWTNQNQPDSDSGGPDSPYSYNVMPLPQMDPSSPSGYILKNFRYYEELTFTAIHGNAPNRGGKGQQVAYTLFYEQRVYFAEGPNKDALVHAENGSLLYLVDTEQPLGPYGNGDNPGLGDMAVQGSTPPTQKYNLVKQVSVPHGNSILALGNYSDTGNNGNGVPDIPAVSPLPTGVDTEQYETQDPVSNPHPALTKDPNLALKNALGTRPCTKYIALSMCGDNSSDRGAVTNIGFEQEHANVTQYDCTYWLEAFDNSPNFTQLQYSQSITMAMPINGKTISFPHITTNTLTKVSGS
ncbi:heme-binding protein [Microbulbifer sp. SAOS-129_SWC]|uniref:heme-binding protein n=1 Tax=Microbulbifer sp. SAOS-129_SWC TaxID=3145235 RepID=UPI003217266B